uniref:MHC class I-like antigen recognition-like domain-containing protein n=1 Tax=Otolemur garnettii TaxID=30611 RepID=H0WVC6_OTOGA
MALTEKTNFISCILVVLLRYCLWAVGAKTHSLSYDFTITRLGCEVQGQVDEIAFLRYECGSKKVKPFGALGKELNGTKTWKEQTETLKDLMDVLTQQLPDLQLGSYTQKDPLPLQATMSCQREANGHTTGSWQFGYKGQKFLLFDPENIKWTLLHPGGRQMKEMWEHGRDMTMVFQKTSVGDCARWLEDFWMCCEKSLKATALPTQATRIAQPKGTATTSIPWSLHVILPCSILLAI